MILMKSRDMAMYFNIYIYEYNTDFRLRILMPYDGYISMMSRWHEKMVLRWWLRSTTGFYRRSEIEVAYREMIFHSTKAVWEMIARKEWLGCRHDISPMFDILGSTPVWASYILFSGFLNIKTYGYVYYFQNLYVV